MALPAQSQTPNQAESQPRSFQPREIQPTDTAGMAQIAMPTDGRGMLVGKTESGKSTLGSKLIAHWRATQPRPRVLVLDSKPRFRASHELNGLPADRRYKKWRRGDVLENSIVLPSGVHVRHAMKQAWNLKFDTVVAQIPNLAYVDWLQAAAGWFYEDSDDDYQQLLYIDELADHFSSSGAYGRGNVLVQTVRSGRERGVAVLAGTQRPSGIPPSFFTEVSRVYLFKLNRAGDIDRLHESVLPEDISPPRCKHVFKLYDDGNETLDVYRLRMEDK